MTCSGRAFRTIQPRVPEFLSGRGIAGPIRPVIAQGGLESGANSLFVVEAIPSVEIVERVARTLASRPVGWKRVEGGLSTALPWAARALGPPPPVPRLP